MKTSWCIAGNLTLGKNSSGFGGKKRRFAAAQGIGGVRQPRCEASGPERQRSPEKPGFRREAPEMRPKQEDKNPCAPILAKPAG
jgi:hypothetical protein